MSDHKAWAEAQEFIFIQSAWCDPQIKNNKLKNEEEEK